MRRIVLSAMMATVAIGLNAQTVQETFNGTRIINGHSTETLKSRVLQYRIEHRFGDLAGDNGGIEQFYGLDQAADIRFALEYGITDKWMVGLGRSKGSFETYRAIVDGFTKYRLLSQTQDNKMPISLTVMGASTISYAKAVADLSQVGSYPDFAHRMAYTGQFVIARKFGERLSLQIAPTYVHRNYVAALDENGVFALGGAAHYKFTKKFAAMVEYYHVVNQTQGRVDMNTTNSLGGGVEWATNGHIFRVNLTNSRGFTETQFIPLTTSEWGEGEFRLGFSITRNFKL